MSLLSDRKIKFREIANANLVDTELADVLFAIDDAVGMEDMKDIKDNYLTFPEKDLQDMKDSIETYLGYLRDRSITGNELEKRKQGMLDATTQQEFVAAYKG